MPDALLPPDQPTPLLGGLSPADFMRRHWQKKPLLIRQAIPGMRAPIRATALRRLAREDDVESRLIWREDGEWAMEHGPFSRLPKASEPDWTLLVQGVDLHDDAIAALRDRFRFVPDARLDDAMISIAGTGGGVGPHVDSYDVFLLQAAGRRRWRISQQKDLELQPDVPLRILQDFRAEEEYVLEPGDMLYLPPQVAHDGVAMDPDCMTISIGFRAPRRAELARGLLEAAADALPGMPATAGERLYRDASQPATATPAALPEALVDEALAAFAAVRLDRALAADFLGAYLSEPKPGVVFEPADADCSPLDADWPQSGTLVLARSTRVLYTGRKLFINGEPAEAPASARLRALADTRRLACAGRAPSEAEREALETWREAGWLHWVPDNDR